MFQSRYRDSFGRDSIFSRWPSTSRAVFQSRYRDSFGRDGSGVNGAADVQICFSPVTGIHLVAT